MNKNILVQYTDLKEEVKELRNKINRLERQISQIKEEGIVKDSVKGGLGGIQHFVVEGFPTPRYNKKINSLRKTKSLLETKEIELLELLNQTEKFLCSIEDSHIRRIINLRVVENMTWQQVADKLGGSNTADSVKMTFHRFIDFKN
ncbi:MAG: hypothetical protein K2I03_08500 [Lachnospiraceae bacterium]|nr:hypothetical protein [Lachnospiraceae bacterium]